MYCYKVCSESNVQHKIFPIQIISNFHYFGTLPNYVGWLVFGDGSDDPLQPRLEALQGQWEASRLRLRPQEEKKKSTEAIYCKERLADHYLAFAAILSPRIWRRCGLSRCPFTKTDPGTTIWDFSAWKLAGTKPHPSWWKQHWRFCHWTFYSAAMATTTLAVLFIILVIILSFAALVTHRYIFTKYWTFCSADICGLWKMQRCTARALAYSASTECTIFSCFLPSSPSGSKICLSFCALFSFFCTRHEVH